QAQATNPWVVQALLGELVGAVARQNQMAQLGFGHQLGIGQPLPFATGMGQLPFATLGTFATNPLHQQPWASPFGNPLQQQPWANPFGQGSYGIGAGLANGVGGMGLGNGVPFPAAAGPWT